MSDHATDRNYQARFVIENNLDSPDKKALYTGLYSSKDGEDILLKTLGVSKNFLFAGIIVGGLNSKSKVVDMKYINARQVYMRRFYAGLIPTFIYGAYFCVATQYIARWRGKDGALNHFLGGMATAPLLSIFWKTSPAIAVPLVFVASVGAAYYKNGRDRNANIRVNRYQWNHQFSLRERLEDRNNSLKEAQK